MTAISDLEKLIDQGKHVDLAPDGTVRVADAIRVGLQGDRTLSHDPVSTFSR